MGQVKVNIYTDPLCCWSYAFEKEWRTLLANYGDSIDYHYIMCGMIPTWATYNDPMNSVSKPLQMGPVWMHASQVTHTKMAYQVWHEDPPSSSYPACIAVKTAALQSSEAGEQYLLKVRSAIMNDGRNIAKTQVLFDVAQQLGDTVLDFEQFKRDWAQGRGKESFRADLQKASYHKIGRYPTLTFQRPDGKGIIITGYRPYEVLEQAYRQVNDHIQGSITKDQR